MKPASLLQKAWNVTSWNIYFRLQTFPIYCSIKHLQSARTRNLIAMYNDVTKELKKSLKSDYEAYKKNLNKGDI